MSTGKVQSVRGRRQRGASPMVGIVLLFVLVMIGATLVFVAGSAMFDALQSEATNERTQQVMLETDHRITTVATTGYDQPLPTDELQGAQVIDDGSVSVAWYTNGTKSNPWADSSCTVSGDLGALEIEQGGNTIAHQGGGIWERSGGETSVVSEPSIGYDGESVQLQILQLKEGDFGGSDPIARANHSAATELTDRINEVGTQCPNPHVAVRIDSSYHDGWNRVMEDALGVDEYDEATVNHNETAGTVEARITEVRDPNDAPSVVVAADHGLVGPGGQDLDHGQRLARSLEDGGGPNSATFGIEGVLENRGDGDPNETVTVTVRDTTGTEVLHDNATVTVPANGTAPLEYPDIKFESSEYNDALEHGESYSYVIETESGDSTDDPPGTFYVGKPGTSLEPSNPRSTVGDDNVTVAADVSNVGVENGSGTVRLELDYRDDLPSELADDSPYDEEFTGEINRSFGETGPVEVDLNKSRLLSGDYNATIRAGGEPVTTSFTVDAGVDPGTAGLDDLENATVEVSVLSSQVSGINRGDHQLGTTTLEVVTEREDKTTTEHVFQNSEGGNNINTYPAWQDKSDSVYNTTFTVDEEAKLTLRSRSYGLPASTAGCVNRDRPRGWFTDHEWCSEFDASSTDYLVSPIDATAETEEQNLRVRTAADNAVPGLQPGNTEQESVDEILTDISDPSVDRESLWNDGELDLENDEFVFLFETTTECGMADSGCNPDDGVDALWESARDNTGSGDPNFNDLIVYVEVDRADVDPRKPSITIRPGDGERPSTGTGDSNPDDGATETDDLGIDVDTSNIVIG